jgi:hypothetical protein
MIHAAAIFMILGGPAAASPAGAQGSSPQASPARQAFEHYEGVRTALSADQLDLVEPHARLLAGQVEAVGGPEAKKAAEALVAATTLEDARTAFGNLSTILVPIFQAEAIPGTTAYMCTMKDKPWVQRGDKVENPYYGKSMLTCGSVLPAKGK